MLRAGMIRLQHMLIHSLSHRHTLKIFIFSLLLVLSARILMDFRSIFGVLGNVTSIIMFLLPARTIYKVKPLQPGNSMERIAANDKWMLYHSAIISHLLWVFYGDLKRDLFVLVINLIGAITETFFSTLFILFTRPITAVMKHLGTILATLAPLYALGRLTIEMDDPYKYAGAICATGSVCLCLLKFGHETERVPFFESVVSLTNAVIWTVYALIASDIVILVPYLVWTFRWLLELVEHSIRHRSPQPQSTVEMGSMSRTEPTEPESGT